MYYLKGTLLFLVRNKNVVEGDYKTDDSIHNLINFKNGSYIHRKGATMLDGSNVIIPLSMSRGCLIVKVKKGWYGYNLSSCAHGAGRIMSRSDALKHWKSLKKKQKKQYEIKFSELLRNGKFNTNQIQELDFAYKNINDFLASQPFLQKISETTPICTVKFSEIR